MKTKKFILCILSIVLFVCLIIFISDFATSSNYFQYRLNGTFAGDTSGRDEYYIAFWQYFINLKNPLNVLLGSGAYSTIKIIGNTAHSDWFEILINNGIVGIVVYLVFVRRFWKLFWCNRRTQYGAVLLCLFLFYFIKSMFSMSYNSIPIMIMVMLGYTLVQIENRNEL